MTTKYVTRLADVEGYSPANHTGTINHRLVGPDVNGAQFLEIIHGDIERHGGAIPHAHPGLEQATYVIEGEATVTIGDRRERVSTGDVMFFPAGVFHAIEILSERIKLLVIYSPPYGESPDKVIKP